MDDELVLLTSYFNLVDGKRQDSADTFRVDPNVPSSTSPDGRAALYIVTEASAGGHMGPRARRTAADTVAWEYGTHTEDPPHTRLKAALRTAHQEVQREFDGHVTVGMTVIAVEGETVYLGQVAPAQVFVLHDGLNSLPASAGGTSPFARALGSTGGPQISVFRDRVESGDFLCLCSSWFETHVDTDELRNAFGAGTADEIADALLELAKDGDARSATAIVIEAALASELEEVPDRESSGFMEQVDSAVQALAGVGRMLWGELRLRTGSNGHEGPTDDSGAGAGSRTVPQDTPLRESRTPSGGRRGAATQDPGSPLEPEPYEEFDSSGLMGPRDRVHEQMTDEVPAVDPPPRGSRSSQRPDLSGSTQIWDEPLVPPTEAESATETEPVSDPTGPEDVESEPRARGSRPVRRTPHETETVSPLPPDTFEMDEMASNPEDARPRRRSEPASPVPSELDEINSRIQNAPDLGDVIPPVQAFPDTSTEPERIYATNKDVDAANKRPRRFGGISRPPIKDPLASPVPVVRPGLSGIDERPTSRNLPSWVVAGSMGAVIVLLVASAYLFLFRHQHAAVHHNPYPALVRKDLALASAARSPANQDVYLNKAKHNIALARKDGSKPAAIQRLNSQWQTTRDTLYHVVPISNPTILSDFKQFPGANPTQLAVSGDHVYVLDAGRKAVYSLARNATSNPQPVVKSGDTFGALTLSTPQLIAVNGSNILALDDKNVLVVSSAGGQPVALALIPPSQTWKPIAMATYTPDAYLLDPLNAQIWRFPGAISGLNQTPARYFDSATPLQDAVSIAFDQSDLYILKSTGTVLKYDLLPVAQKFNIDNAALRTPLRKPTALYTEAGANFVWIADPANNRIVQLDKSGAFIHSYESRDRGLNLGRMQSMSVSPDGKTLYVLADLKVYDFPVR